MGSEKMGSEKVGSETIAPRAGAVTAELSPAAQAPLDRVTIETRRTPSKMSPETAAPRADAGAWTYRIAAAWAFVAIVLAGVHQIANLSQPFSYRWSWVTADIATTARSFAKQGFLVPVNNNPPLGSEVSAYLHWPPLTPVFLGFWYRAFGISERSTHAFSLAVSVIAGLALWLLARFVLGRVGAMIALIAWCTFPVSIEYSHLPSQQNVGMGFTIFSLICAIRFADEGKRRWILPGLILISAAVATTWEALFLGPGLMLAGRFIVRRPQVTRAGFYFSVAGAITAGGILAAYFLTYPNLSAEMAGTILHRLGWTSNYGTGILHVHVMEGKRTLASMVHTIGYNLSSMLGIGLLGFGAALAVIVDRRGEQTDWRAQTAIISTAVLWMAWFALFLNHPAVHAFECALAAPSAALAVAWCLLRLLRSLQDTGPTLARRLAIALILPAATLVPQSFATTLSSVHQEIETQPGEPPNDALVEQGKEIGRITEPGSVILTRSGSTILLFYSERHFIRFVLDDQVLTRMLPLIVRNFAPHTPIYLAISKGDEDYYPVTLKEQRRQIFTPHATLVRLDH
jgi:dolichyl-phosphate-mannose-protein mannosyltransferase